MTEFQGVLNSKIKVYVDPYPDSEVRVMGYKGWSPTQENIDKMRALLAQYDRETLSDNPKDVYSKAGFDYWTEVIARWDSGDHSDGSEGFFYCPYIPQDLPESLQGVGFKVKKELLKP
jgi:hypothetical protein